MQIHEKSSLITRLVPLPRDRPYGNSLRVDNLEIVQPLFTECRLREVDNHVIFCSLINSQYAVLKRVFDIVVPLVPDEKNILSRESALVSRIKFESPVLVGMRTTGIRSSPSGVNDNRQQ